MKTVEEIQDEYVSNISPYDKFSSWSEYRNYNNIEDEDLKIIATRYAQQYKERIAELEDELKKSKKLARSRQ